MFVLTFERALFKFSANTPDSPELFQLPPRIGSLLTRNPLLLSC